MGFGKRLAQAYLAKYKNRADFARAIGKQYHQVSGWEGGKIPDRDNLKLIATHLDVTIDWLLDGDRPEGRVEVDEAPLPADWASDLDWVVEAAQLDEGQAKRLRDQRRSIGFAISRTTLFGLASDIKALSTGKTRDRTEADVITRPAGTRTMAERDADRKKKR
jgi:transcriptional regulator with XRE-family HTH domain